MLEIAHALTIFADGLFLLPIASITLRASDRVLALSGFSTSNLPGRSPKTDSYHFHDIAAWMDDRGIAAKSLG